MTHSNGKLKVLTREKWERDIAEAPSKYNCECHLVGKTLPIEQQTYCIKIVQMLFMCSNTIKQVATFP